MKSLTIIAAMAAASVNAGTNKTLAPTPGVDRPNAPPPITPFPTEPNVVSISCLLFYCLLQLVCGAGVWWCCNGGVVCWWQDGEGWELQ